MSRRSLCVFCAYRDRARRALIQQQRTVRRRGLHETGRRPRPAQEAAAPEVAAAVPGDVKRQKASSEVYIPSYRPRWQSHATEAFTKPEQRAQQASKSKPMDLSSMRRVTYRRSNLAQSNSTPTSDNERTSTGWHLSVGEEERSDQNTATRPVFNHLLQVPWPIQPSNRQGQIRSKEKGIHEQRLRGADRDPPTLSSAHMASVDTLLSPPTEDSSPNEAVGVVRAVRSSKYITPDSVKRIFDGKSPSRPDTMAELGIPEREQRARLAANGQGPELSENEQMMAQATWSDGPTGNQTDSEQDVLEPPPRPHQPWRLTTPFARDSDVRKSRADRFGSQTDKVVTRPMSAPRADDQLVRFKFTDPLRTDGEPSEFLAEANRVAALPRASIHPALLGRTRGRDTSLLEEEDINSPVPRQKIRRRRSTAKSDDEVDELDVDETAEERQERLRRDRRIRKRNGPAKPIFLPDFISVSGLASRLKVDIVELLQRLRKLGFGDLSHDHVLTAENAGLIAAEYRFEPTFDNGTGEDLTASPVLDDQSHLPPRPPVITIMGHVDHGKTTILDYLRKSSVAAAEHGGITQHIGAFSVSMPSGKLITFLDTPGHEAFLSMRQRGANVTDIVILVVAADDSVKPQTIEAIKHAKTAKVPIIVAINKIDKPEANAERVKQDLARHGVEVEDIGGDTQVIGVSGKTGQGMVELEDATVTLSEVLDLRADPGARCEGWILEAATKKGGRVATVLVRQGTLSPGQIFVAGTTWARVRRLADDAGASVESAGPGTPVEVDGWRELPDAGTEVLECSDESQAKSVVAFRTKRAETQKQATDVEAVNEARRLDHIEWLERRAERVAQARREGKKISRVRIKDKTPTATNDGGPLVVPFIIKGDVSGSVEAVEESVKSLGNDLIRTKILDTGVGLVNESDVEMASVAKGEILAFNTKCMPGVDRMAEMAGVRVLEHSIIYHLTDEVIQTLTDRLPPIVTHSVTGEADIAEIFNINIKRRLSKPIAGCRVRNGVINRNAKVRVLHHGITVYDGGSIFFFSSPPIIPSSFIPRWKENFFF